MTYRDDRDALLARADALERETERLRRENERLKEATPPPPPAAPTYPSSPLALSLSLQTNTLDWVLVIPMVIGSAAILLGLGDTSDGGQIALCIVAILGFLALCMGISTWMRWRQIRGEQRWIDTAPLGLAPAAYRQLLSEHHASRAVTVRIELGGAPTETVRDALGAAVGGRWDEHSFVVASPSFETVRARKSIVFHDNAQVHRWVRQLVDERLAPFAVTHPIKSVQVTNA